MKNFFFSFLIVPLFCTPSLHAKDEACLVFGGVKSVSELRKASELGHSDTVTAAMKDDIDADTYYQIIEVTGAYDFESAFKSTDDQYFEYVDYTNNYRQDSMRLYFWKESGTQKGVVIDPSQGNERLARIEGDRLVDCLD